MVQARSTHSKPSLKPTLNPTLKRHAYSTRLIHMCVHSRVFASIRGSPFALFAFFAVKKTPSIRVHSRFMFSAPLCLCEKITALSTKATKLLTRLATKRSGLSPTTATVSGPCLLPTATAYCYCPLSPASCLLSHTRSKKIFPGGVDVAGGVCYITPPCHGKGGCSSRPLRQEPAVPPRRGLTDVARFATFSNRRKGGLVL